MRPKKTDTPDLGKPLELTAGAIERLTCPPGKQQAFLRDSKAPGLRVRVTAAGAKAYVYEAKLNRQTIRRTLGDVRSWSIEQARAAARELAVTLDRGQDPRELERRQMAERAAEATARQRAQALAEQQAVTGAQAWDDYLTDRRPHWGERHYRDHVQLARAGGQRATRGTRGRGVTIDGPLYPLLALPLAELTPAVVEQWAHKEGQTRPTTARLAWRLLRAFLGWCAEHPHFGAVVTGNPAKSRRAREALGKAGAKDDALLREQLPAWFTAVQALRNPLHAAYLQCLLLLGCRPGELLALRWEDINTQWRGLSIRDKVEGERVIPLPPYVHHLLASLPRRGPCVFAGAGDADTPMAPPRKAMVSACAVAGVHVTLHGLRRSFGSLAEWLEVPAGVVAQIQGHKPSATAERHYRVRPLDLLRTHHERIESWILEQAGVHFEPQAEPGKLRAVA